MSRRVSWVPESSSPVVRSIPTPTSSETPLGTSSGTAGGTECPQGWCEVADLRHRWVDRGHSGNVAGVPWPSASLGRRDRISVARPALP